MIAYQISAMADGSATIAEMTAAAMSHHRGRTGMTVPMSTLPDVVHDVKLSLRANGTRRIHRGEARCDRQRKTGRRSGSVCGALATHYDASSLHNLCGVHVRNTPTARLGRGRSWYETPCATPDHDAYAAVAIGADGVARCEACSLDYERAAPAPVIDAAYFAALRAGAFA